MRLRALVLYVGLALIVGAMTGYIYASLRNPEPTSVPVIQVREEPEVLDDKESPGDRKKQRGSSKDDDRSTDGGASGTSGGSSVNSNGGTPQQESSGGSGGRGPGAPPAAPPPPAPAGQDDDVDVDNDIADRGDDDGSD